VKLEGANVGDVLLVTSDVTVDIRLTVVKWMSEDVSNCGLYQVVDQQMSNVGIGYVKWMSEDVSNCGLYQVVDEQSVECRYRKEG
jgi:hypothetical protein